MKKASIRLFVLVLICMLACSAYAGAKPIKVTIDPRIELLSAVELTSDYWMIVGFDFQYKQRMARYFAPYKDHRAVKLFTQMSKEGFTFDGPPELMVCLSNPPELTLRPPSTCLTESNVKNLLEKAGGEDQLIEFVESLRDFARDTDFQKFFDANQETYRAITREVSTKVNGVDIIGLLEGYYSAKNSQLEGTIVLAPLFMGSYGLMVEHKDGHKELLDICGSLGVVDGLPIFGDSDDICELAWHEFGHSFANPLVDKHWSALEKYASLNTPIVSMMRQQGYGPWKTTLYEHMVRAVEARIIHQVRGDKAAEEFIEEQQDKGFAYIRPLCDRLAYYEKHRDKYPTLDSFYLELVGVYKSLQERKLGPEFYSTRSCIYVNGSYVPRSIVVNSAFGIAPDGKRIAYPVISTDENGDLITETWVCELEGSAGKKVTESIGILSVSWYDSSQLTNWASSANSIQQIRLVSLNGDTRELPLADYTLRSTPAVSPDGKWVAFSARKTQSTQGGVFLLNIEAGTIRMLSSGIVKSSVSWSPDSGKLAYGEGSYKRDYNLIICDIDTNSVIDTGQKGVEADWSPDGKWLAYTGDVIKGGTWIDGIPTDAAIVKMNVETRETKSLTEPGVNQYDKYTGISRTSGSLSPLWSPDGKRIAYRRIQTTHQGKKETLHEESIWVMNADGTNRRKLRSGWAHVAWSPNSKAILIKTETGIERITVSTGKSKEVVQWKLPAVIR